jgi:uncharacterized protein (TIGR02466 family)
MRHDIFPIHYYQTQISENESLKRKYLNKIVETYREKHVGSPKGWITNKMHTSFEEDKLNEEIFVDYTELDQLYSSYVNTFMGDSWSGYIESLWFNCYIDGDYQEQHNHVNPSTVDNCHFSCIHYLSFDKTRHKPVVFCDPLDALRSTNLELKSHKYDGRHYPQIEEGDLLMFPSYLNHYVSPSQKTEDYPRVTISFNLKLERYGN